MALLESYIDPSNPFQSPSTSINQSFTSTPSSNKIYPYRNNEDDDERELRHSYKCYSCWNSGRFILIGFLIVIIAMMRQLRLLQHYTIPACCFCYYIAATADKTGDDTMFEWQTCEVQTWDHDAPLYNHS